VTLEKVLAESVQDALLLAEYFSLPKTLLCFQKYLFRTAA
jgi:hypothetical protein